MQAPIKNICVRTLKRPKGNFVPNGIAIGFEMRERCKNKQTDKLFRISINRDNLT